MGDALLDAHVAGIKQRHRRRSCGCVLAQPPIEFEHRGQRVGCSRSAPGRSGSQPFLKDVIVCDESEEVQLGEVASLWARLKLLRHGGADQHDRPAVLADVLSQAQPEVAIGAIAIQRCVKLWAPEDVALYDDTLAQSGYEPSPIVDLPLPLASVTMKSGRRSKRCAYPQTGQIAKGPCTSMVFSSEYSPH